MTYFIFRLTFPENFLGSNFSPKMGMGKDKEISFKRLEKRYFSPKMVIGKERNIRECTW